VLPWRRCILLCLIEAVYLIHEKDGLHTEPTILAGVLDGLHDVGLTGSYRAELDEFGSSFAGDDPGQRRLARSGRSPQNKTRRLLLLDHLADDLAGAHQMLLPEHVVAHRSRD
jgi:hypothetical protein